MFSRTYTGANRGQTIMGTVTGLKHSERISACNVSLYCRVHKLLTRLTHAPLQLCLGNRNSALLHRWLLHGSHEPIIW